MWLMFMLLFVWDHALMGKLISASFFGFIWNTIRHCTSDTGSKCREEAAIRLSGAAFFPAVKLVVALPDGLAVLAVGMPHLGAIPAPAVRTFYPAGEYAHAARPVLPGMPGRHLVLRLLEHGGADDGLVVVLHIILRHLALVYLLLLGEEVHRVHLLQESVAFIFFVGKNAFDRAGRPCLLATGRWYGKTCACLFRDITHTQHLHSADKVVGRTYRLCGQIKAALWLLSERKVH